jgi:hypothetical protein
MDTETVPDAKPVIEEKVEIAQTETAAQAPVETQETEQQINWRKFREQREVERKQKEAAEKRAQEKEAEAQALKAAMDALLNKQTQRPAQNDTYYDNQNDSQFELSDDDKIQRKVEEAIAKKEAEYERTRKEREAKEYPQRLLSEYRDFNEVCSAENLDYLEFHHPEIASAFKYAPDGYDKWANIYKVTKKLIPNAGSLRETKKAEINFQKPQSMAVPGSTPTGDTAPIYLDDKKRADNWARMQRVMKGA